MFYCCNIIILLLKYLKINMDWRIRRFKLSYCACAYSKFSFNPYIDFGALGHSGDHDQRLHQYTTL